MMRSLGVLPSILIATALVACTAEPTSLGDPDSEDGTSGSNGSTDDDPTATSGASMDGPGTGSQSGTGSSDAGTSSGGSIFTTTDPTATATDEGSGDSSETDEPGDAATVLFVNFDGPTLTAGIDDATIDQASVAGSFSGMPLDPFGDGPKRDDIMTRLDEIWAPFDVAITDTRPASGDYAMIVVTPTNPFGGGVLGIASQDCGDANPTSVGMVFSGIGDAYSASLVATVISHEAGRGYGLENVDAPGDVMSQFAEEVASFLDQCRPLVGMPTCNAEHEVFCPAGQQNGFAELSAAFPR